MKKNYKYVLAAVIIATAAGAFSYYSFFITKSNANAQNLKTDEIISLSSSQKTEDNIEVNGNPHDDIYESVIESQHSDKEVQKINISECDIIADDVTYNGKFTEPSVKVSYNGTVLSRNVDYKIEYDSTEDRGVGRYYFTVAMLGEYEGSTVKSYNVIPEQISFASVKTKVSEFQLDWLPSGNADGYEIAISKYENMSVQEIITVDGCESSTYLKENLPQNSVYYVKIRSYAYTDTEDGEEKIYSLWSNRETVETKKIEVIDGVTYIDGILIANKTYSLPENYGSGLNDEALEAFQTMSDDASADGINLYIVSGYRSYWLQDSIYNNFCAQRGVSEADRVSARPGHSEHQTGLAMDINSTLFSFADTPEAKWLADNCWKYGFVIRYPQNKEDITGYAYEAWHIRYLGKEIAKELYESGLTLEEYLGITSQYG